MLIEGKTKSQRRGMKLEREAGWGQACIAADELRSALVEFEDRPEDIPYEFVRDILSQFIASYDLETVAR